MEYGLRKHLHISDIDDMLFTKFKWMNDELCDDLKRQQQELEERLKDYAISY